MGNSPPPGCLYKNQGETIFDLKEQMYKNIRYSREVIGSVNTVLSLYDKNLKTLTDITAFYNTTLSNYKEIDNRFNSEIQGQIKVIEALLIESGLNYKAIDEYIQKHDVTNQNINTKKNNIMQKSNSIVYFENLILAAYKEIYNSVTGQNKAIQNNESARSDMYSIDNSTYVYQQNRIQFYKNLNTGLFYTYYALILVLIYVILRMNNENNILVKLTLFRIYVIALILYPLFILRFQHFIYNLFHYFYKRLAPDDGL
jgi:hypothetical protein